MVLLALGLAGHGIGIGSVMASRLAGSCVGVGIAIMLVAAGVGGGARAGDDVGDW